MRRITALFAVLAFAAGCHHADPLPEAPGEAPTRDVSIIISGGGLPASGTRSSVTATEDGIRSADIFIYCGEQLQNDLTQHMSFSGQGVKTCTRTVALTVGKTYDLLVIANGSPGSAPSTLDNAISQLSYEASGISSFNSAGIPMSGRKRFYVTPTSQNVEVPLVRLVSKVNFSVRTSQLEHGSIVFSSIAVRQMNKSCPFFADGRAGDRTCDGDLASSADLASINSSPDGYSTSFYLLENLQGDILAGNTDPEAKIPDRITAAGGKPARCTYLELTGRYNGSSGALKSENLTARLFLGGDACSNFDIVRNSQYNIELSITDEGCLRTDWKIDGHLEDNRTLSFNPAVATLNPGGTLTAEINTNLSYSAGDYSYSVGGDVMCFDVNVSNGGTRFDVRCLDSAAEGASLQLNAATWDGRHTCSCTVTAKSNNSDRYDIGWKDGTGVLYLAQRGELTIVDKRTGSYPSGTVRVLNSTGCADVTRIGTQWYVDAIEAGEDVLTVNIDGSKVAEIPFLAAIPILTFPSDRIFLPMDGSVVACGPYYRKADGTLLNYSDFQPDLYEEMLDVSVVRKATSDMCGTWWTQATGGGNPIVRSSNLAQSYYNFGFYIAALSSGGHGIGENYSLQNGPVTLERITAYPNDRECGVAPVSAELYTAEPFSGSRHLGARSSWALTQWYTGSSHDETFVFSTGDMVLPGNDYSSARAVYPFSSENKYSFRYINNSTVEMTILYSDNVETAMPEHYFSFAPAMRNRHSGEQYVSPYRYSVDFTVNLALAGVAAENGAGGCDVSVEWAFPRLDDGRLSFLEDNVVCAVSDRGTVEKGMYVNLYTVYGYSADYLMESAMPEYSFADLTLAPGRVSKLDGDSYHVPEDYGVGYDLVLWKYESINPYSNGWLEK